jgi:hypothetical protein
MADIRLVDHVVPLGEHTRTEYLVRITTPDGRVTDHGPYTSRLPSTLAIAGLVFRCPPGSKTTRLQRTVTTIATEWEPVVAEPKEGGR